MVVQWVSAVCLAVFSWAWVWAGSALAQPPPKREPEPPTITVELQVEPDHQPDYLCVITETGDPRTGTGAVVGPPDSSLQLAELAGARIDGPLAPSAASPSGVASWDIWQFTSRENTDLGARILLGRRPMIRDALEAMAISGSAGGEEASCDIEPSLCAPRFDIPASVEEAAPEGSAREQVNLHITCGQSIRGVRPEGSRRVAVMFLSLHQGVKKAVQNVRLDGTVATLRLGGRLSPSDILVGSVIGGHYVYGSSYTSIENRIVMPLVPRCVRRAVEMPPVGALPRTGIAVRLRHKGMPDHACLAAPDRGTVGVVIPYFRDTGRTILTAEVLDPKRDKPATRFEASWSGHLPPDRVTTQLTVVSFSWLQHCFYPEKKKCPAASLSDTGIACESIERARGECSYRCDVGEKNLSIELPTTVRFERPDSNDVWDTKMSSTNQQLRGHVAPPERAMELNFRKWHDIVDTDLQLIDEVAVLFPDGRKYSVLSTEDLPTGWHRRIYPIPAPGTLCTDEVRIRVTGLRFLEDQRAKAGDGTIVAKHPRELGSRTGTVAPTFGVDSNGYFYGGFRLGLHWIPWDIGGPVALELYQSMMFGRRSTVHNGSGLKEGVFQMTISLGGLASLGFGPAFLGVGLDGGANVAVTPNIWVGNTPPNFAYIAPMALLRVPLLSTLWIDITARQLFGEGEVTLKPVTDDVVQVVSETGSTSRYDISVRYSPR